MKVLHINSNALMGGAEQVAVDLLKNPFVSSMMAVKCNNGVQDRQIIELRKNLLDRLFRRLDRKYRRKGYNNDFKVLFSIAEKYNGTYRKLKSIPAYREADIIHLHNIHGNYFDLSCLAKIAREKPIVWTLHDMWPLTGGEIYTYDNLNYQKGIGQTDIDYLYPAQNPLVDRRQEIMEEKKQIYTEIAGKITFVPVSQWLEAAVKKAYVYNNRLDVQYIYNGIDTSVFKNKGLRNWTRPRILFFNSSGESKASHLFVNILDKISAPFDLYLIGKELEYTGISNYNAFIKDRNELMELYNQVDILVFPSKAETFGLLPLEAMACGVCVIASDSTALPEVVNSEVGFTFHSGDEQDLLQKVNTCLQNLPGAREKGEKGASFARDKFNLHKCHEAYYTLYQKMLSRKTG